MTSDMETALTINDAMWQELLELTGGAAAPCFQCGVCTATCPWGQVRQKPFSVRTILRDIQLGLLDHLEDLWLCTACSQCEASCPRGVPIAEVLRSLRYLLWKQRLDLDNLPSVMWSVYWNNNPLSQPPSQRMAWADGLDLPAFDPNVHEWLLYIGCTGSYDRRAQSIAKALVKIMRAAEVSFGVLGEEEPCCGETVFRLGHTPYFHEVAQHAEKTFEAHGVKQLVALSPHSYDVFANHYPPAEHMPQAWHYTQLMQGWLQQCSLSLRESVHSQVAFHDPCLLSRGPNPMDLGRAILAEVPGLDVVHMASEGSQGICCGGGGGRMWMETAAGERFADLRLAEAVDAGAQILATACPFCVACLEDSLKAHPQTNMVVRDIAELIAEAID
ncbi:MAG: heterodisulfide reductase-related iron-sulfur binding cluster [Anaerolineales bacterium]